MQRVHPNDSTILAENGLNLQAVFDLASLPDSMRQAIEQTDEAAADYRQLLLFGHGGQRMWQALSTCSGLSGEHPIDTFSAEVVNRYFVEENPDNQYVLLYPGHQRVLPLQQLGQLAGWHHASPFRIGVNAQWGSWFAYRAVVLADTSFTPTAPMADPSPCESCKNKLCLAACPVASGKEIQLDACMDERLKEGTLCGFRCLARIACPVKPECRYEPEQITYHYGQSLMTIRRYRESGNDGR